MNDELPKGCRTCQNRRYISNVCERTEQFVSFFSESEWAEYLGKWEKAVATELATAERVLKRHPDKKTKAEVKRLKKELESIRARPLGRVVGGCSYFKRHTAILPIFTKSTDVGPYTLIWRAEQDKIIILRFGSRGSRGEG